LTDYDRPPTPPLAPENVNLLELEVNKKFDCAEEDWNEGIDAKWRTYHNIRTYKRKVWNEEKQLRKQQEKMEEILEAEKREAAAAAAAESQTARDDDDRQTQESQVTQKPKKKKEGTQIPQTAWKAFNSSNKYMPYKAVGMRGGKGGSNQMGNRPE